MKTKCCEKCGKEFGFFDFRHEIKSERIGVHYDCLCGKCYRILSDGIDRLDSLYADMIEVLKERYHIDNMAAVDLDLLIFLAVEAIFKHAPDYHDSQSKINQALINRGDRSSGPVEDLCKIVEYLIDYGFGINKKNAQVVDFASYFARTTLFCEQVGMNRKEGIPKSYYHLFLSCRGLAASHMETGESFSMAVYGSGEHLYETVNETEILLKSCRYPDDEDREVLLYPLDGDQSKAIRSTLDRFNEIAGLRRERKRRDTIANICRGVYKDLKNVKPDERFFRMPLDCILIFIVKNMMADPADRTDDIFKEDGLLMDILFEKFYENLVRFGRTSRPDVLEYIQKNTLLSKDFYIQYDKKAEKGWGFFTTKGYILCFLESRKYVYVFEDVQPNDIYYPCSDLVYKGFRYLQLAERKKDSEASGNYRDFDGLIFFSRDIAKMGEMNRFFNLNSTLYVMDRYDEAKSRVCNNREEVLEIKRVSDKMFGEVSFLPFCQYDEWAAILEKMREDDFLLRQIIDQQIHGQKYSPAASTVYTLRIMKVFNTCAKELEETLHFGDLSIAKAILWKYFNNSLIDVLSREWIRIAGDIVRPGDSLEAAFSKYFNMSGIDSARSYYLGLYIYYLMSKGILPVDDFLENYERCISVYQKYNQSVEETQIKRILKEKGKPVTDEIPDDSEDEAVLSKDGDRTERLSNAEGSMTDIPKEQDPEKADRCEDAPAEKDADASADEKTESEQIDLNGKTAESGEAAESEDEIAEDEVSEADSQEAAQVEMIEEVQDSASEDTKASDEKDQDRREENEQAVQTVGTWAKGMKEPPEILAEMAAKGSKNLRPIRRIIEDED